jgi:SseB protein N-terminal domain
MAEEPATETLLEVLREARSHLDADVERRLLAALATSQLIVAVDTDPETGELGIRASRNPDGSRHLLCFTSVQELERWAHGTPMEHRVISGRDLAALAEPADAAVLWIDPASEHGGGLPRDRIDLVAAHEEGERPSATVELRTGPEPLSVAPLEEPLPAPVLRRLRDAVAAEQGVNEAWLLAGSGPGAADFVLAVAGDEPAPSPALALALQEALPPGASADIYPIGKDELTYGGYDAVRLGEQVYP